ncbi:FecR domain-containing protein, partial [Rhodoplanes sp. TEM]
ARLWRADVSTGFGEQRRVSLPDGTAALLNTDSALALGFRPGVRRVALLQGEALFEVTPDAVPFRVAALGGEVEALGTGFAVRAVAGEAAVTVTDGRVRVSAGGGPDGAVEVRPREQARYRDAGGPVRVAAVDLDEVLSWRAGRIVFEGRPFGEALAELARYVPETVVLADRRAAAEPVSAVFSVGQAVAAIAALAATQNLTMRRIPGLAILIS